MFVHVRRLCVRCSARVWLCCNACIVRHVLVAGCACIDRHVYGCAGTRALLGTCLLLVGRALLHVFGGVMIGTLFVILLIGTLFVILCNACLLYTPVGRFVFILFEFHPLRGE